LNIKQIEAKLRISFPRIHMTWKTLVAELIQFVTFMRTEKPASVNESAEFTTYKLLS